MTALTDRLRRARTRLRTAEAEMAAALSEYEGHPVTWIMNGGRQFGTVLTAGADRLKVHNDATGAEYWIHPYWLNPDEWMAL